uniref:Uncharacterized protein n=1 Tax=Steinernema glaseri TaxID=37863 RepID=A0A1I7ZUA9_9BILA
MGMRYSHANEILPRTWEFVGLKGRMRLVLRAELSGYPMHDCPGCTYFLTLCLLKRVTFSDDSNRVNLIVLCRKEYGK